jgi:hypothetical protein
MDSTPPQPQPPDPPPRAFTQGVGTVFQFIGVTLFLASMFVCCGSSLFSKNVAERRDLMAVGWNVPLPGGPYFYSAQQAITVSVLLAVFFGIALAGLGLGLQAQGRRAPWGAVAVCSFATIFWLVQAIFFGHELRSIMLSAGAAALALFFGGLTALAFAALAEMRRNPPPAGHEILPADFKVPYSHLHEDPPEVRLARELDQRREKLAVQQKELEMLEARLRRKLEQRPADPAARPDSPPPPATGDAP